MGREGVPEWVATCNSIPHPTRYSVSGHAQDEAVRLVPRVARHLGHALVVLQARRVHLGEHLRGSTSARQKVKTQTRAGRLEHCR